MQWSGGLPSRLQSHGMVIDSRSDDDTSSSCFRRGRLCPGSMGMWRLNATAAAAVASTSWVTSLGAAFHANPIGFMTSVAMCIGSIALAGLLIAAIPALASLKKTMDSAHVLLESLEEELPDAVAAIKLSGLEMADAMEEVSGLGSDLTAGIRASARALVGAETGVRQGAQMASGAITKSLPTAKGTICIDNKR